MKNGEDPTFKTNYSFIHHYVSSDGSPGAAALGGLREGIGSLNGARGGSVLRGSDRKGVYNHLARHYRESGEKPLDLKSDEEMATDGAENGNRKLVPVVARHGEGLDDGDYVSMKMFGKFGRIEEGNTRNEIHNNSRAREQGFEIDEEIDEQSDILNQ